MRNITLAVALLIASPAEHGSAATETAACVCEGDSRGTALPDPRGADSR
jgi:hypothetical protein